MFEALAMGKAIVRPTPTVWDVLTNEHDALMFRSARGAWRRNCGLIDSQWTARGCHTARVTGRSTTSPPSSAR